LNSSVSTDSPTTSDHTRRGFARLLWRLADLVRVAETRRSFRAKAYRRAIWSLDDLPGLDVAEEVILATPGIGPGVTALIREFRESGQLRQLAPLEANYPSEAVLLRRLPRMSPRTLRDLKAELGVETVVDLAVAIESEAAATVRGVGLQTLELWREILELAPNGPAAPAHRGWVFAIEVAAHINRHTGAAIEVAGEVRRVEEWVHRLDLVVVTTERSALDGFLERTAVLGSFTRADRGGDAMTHDGLPVVFHVSAPSAAGMTLVDATGPPEHVALFQRVPPVSEETEVYSIAGLDWVPPPARGLEPATGIQVVTVDDVKGDLHLHSESSPDGRMTLEEICDSAVRRGYEYVLITDHTQGLRFGGLDEAGIARQAEAIERLRPRHPDLRIFHGAELNIGRDGTLDLDDETLSGLDFAVAGVHSYFGLGQREQTDRVVRALAHPRVRVLAHPFGRRIGIRPPLSIDMPVVIEAAVEHAVALETNGHRDRLDLPAKWVERASSLGAVFAANSDAHRLGEIGNVANAVATLQRAGTKREQVINARNVGAFIEWLNEGD